jgi:hypothetical protein
VELWLRRCNAAATSWWAAATLADPDNERQRRTSPTFDKAWSAVLVRRVPLAPGIEGPVWRPLPFRAHTVMRLSVDAKLWARTVSCLRDCATIWPLARSTVHRPGCCTLVTLSRRHCGPVHILMTVLTFRTGGERPSLPTLPTR